MDLVNRLLSVIKGKPDRYIVTIVNPDNTDCILERTYSYSVWVKLADTYKKAFTVLSVVPVYDSQP